MFHNRLRELHKDRTRLLQVIDEQRVDLAAPVAVFSRAWMLVEESFAWYRLFRRSLKVLRHGARRWTRALSRKALGG